MSRLVIVLYNDKGATERDKIILPEALASYKGETILDRMIRQARKAGINDIFFIVGDKKEFFLEYKYSNGVTILSNKLFDVCNSFHVLDDLVWEETFYCFGNDIYEENVFLYKYDESVRFITNNEKIAGFYKKQEDLGNYSEIKFLEKGIILNTLDNKMVKDVFVPAIANEIMQNIISFHNCKESDITNIRLMNTGYTNSLFLYEIFGEKYVFRYPGASSDLLTNRSCEVAVQEYVNKSGLDSVTLYVNESGIRISRYVNGLDISDKYINDLDFMSEITCILKKLHSIEFDFDKSSEFVFEPMKKADELLEFISKRKGDMSFILGSLREKTLELYRYTEMDGIKKTICHNDVYDRNLLCDDENMNLIDWEFSGIGDPAFDFGRLFLFYDLEGKEIEKLLNVYFGRKATELESLHWIAYIGIHSWYFLIWCIYREVMNETSDDWMMILYDKLHDVLEYCIPRYKRLYDI